MLSTNFLHFQKFCLKFHVKISHLILLHNLKISTCNYILCIIHELPIIENKCLDHYMKHV